MSRKSQLHQQNERHDSIQLCSVLGTACFQIKSRLKNFPQKLLRECQKGKKISGPRNFHILVVRDG